MSRATELVSHTAVTQSYIYPHPGHALLADDMLFASRIHSNPKFKTIQYKNLVPITKISRKLIVINWKMFF